MRASPPHTSQSILKSTETSDTAYAYVAQTPGKPSKPLVRAEQICRFTGRNVYGSPVLRNQNLQKEIPMPFLPFLGITFASFGLIKLGALMVMVQALSAAVVVLLLIAVGLAALLALKHKKS